MATDVAAFQARFPEFDSAVDSRVQAALDEANLIHSIRELATLYCAAHLLTLDNQLASDGAFAGSPSEVKSRQVGPLRSDYVTQAKAGWQAFFSSTAYGRRFLTLERRCARTGIGAMVA